MPLREDLLNPIAGPNPCGENLRYAPLYDQIKEARREEEPVTQGDWQTPGKKANWPQVIKLTSDALAGKSKDLQLAAWLLEAMIHTEGYAALKPGLDLLRGLLENFWDGLYPELEDGDAELRATPLEWVGSQLDIPIKRIPLTRNRLDWFQYKQSRSVPTEEECSSSEVRRAQREAALAEGKLTPEAFDAGFAATPKDFYEQAFQQLEQARDALESLRQVAEEKFGDFAPSFGGLRTTLEEVQQTVRVLLQRKLELEAPPAEPEVEAAEAEAVAETGWAIEEAEAAPARPRPRAPRKALAPEPEDREDAIQRLIAVARFLRKEDPYSPASYLVLRALRWGELRAAGPNPDYSLLEAPPTETRQQLKRLTADGYWQEALDLAEETAGLPCGRAWLDLQRYAVRALSELGYEAPAAALRAELRSLLADFPELPNWTLNDDTPAANAETQAWLKEEVMVRAAEPEPVAAPRWEEPPAAQPPEDAAEQADPYQLAVEALRSGRPQEAVELLARESAKERCGRARFQRRIQLAEICMAAGYDSVAWPILEELAQEIERRKLEEWEAPEVVAHPLVLLFRCLSKLDRDSEEKQKIYARICRLDPRQALACAE